MRIVQSLALVQVLAYTSAFVHQKHSTTAASSRTCLFDSPEPLAEEGTWQAFLDDETTGLVYYFDTESGESLWEPPTTTFPAVRLPRKQQRLAEELRRSYRKSRQQETQEVGGDSPVQVIEETKTLEGGSGLPSWIEGLVEVKDKSSSAGDSVEAQGEPATDAKPGFFSGLFGDKGTFNTQREDESAAEETLAEDKSADDEVSPKKEKGGFFAAFGGLTKDKAFKADAVEAKVVESEASSVKKTPEKKEEPKIVDTSSKPIKIEIGQHILPHPAKVRWGGEDAVFVKGRTFGVFDGVSGAEKLDGVPLYSRTLANEMKKSIGNDGLSVQEITQLLTDAANFADDSATGASTAVVASIGENGFLQALNLGDSLCMLVRDGKIAAKTREISHYWECPYQLSEDSPDRPRDGTKLNVELIQGDIIIMGSDGIFDNVSDDMLLELLSKNSKLKPNQLSKKICELSRKQSLDAGAETPYGKQAQRRGDPAFKSGLGGKVDDASCVVVACK